MLVLDRYFEDELEPSNDVWTRVVRTRSQHPLGGIMRLIDHYSLPHGGQISGGHDHNIPEPLRARKQWVWLEPRANTESEKSVHLCRGVPPGKELAPQNWLSHTDAGYMAGTGYVLNNTPLIGSLIPVVIEITPQSRLSAQNVDNLWTCLGHPYIEFSREGNGWIIVGLVRAPLPTYQAPGVKIFTSGGYAEICGLGARGKLKDITDEIAALNAYQKSPTNNLSSHPQPNLNRSPETPRRRAELEAMLHQISADCTYDEYRNIVWAILGTGWADAEDIAKRWCMTAPHRFEEDSLKTVCRSFDACREKRPTIGTIIHYARLGGSHG